MARAGRQTQTTWPYPENPEKTAPWTMQCQTIRCQTMGCQTMWR
jgi:hypothetical protein